MNLESSIMTFLPALRMLEASLACVGTSSFNFVLGVSVYFLKVYPSSSPLATGYSAWQEVRVGGHQPDSLQFPLRRLGPNWPPWFGQKGSLVRLHLAQWLRNAGNVSGVGLFLAGRHVEPHSPRLD